MREILWDFDPLSSFFDNSWTSWAREMELVLIWPTFCAEYHKCCSFISNLSRSYIQKRFLWIFVWNSILIRKNLNKYHYRVNQVVCSLKNRSISAFVHSIVILNTVLKRLLIAVFVSKSVEQPSDEFCHNKK